MTLKIEERTSPQLGTEVIITEEGDLLQSYSKESWAKKLKKLKKDPTISLVRQLFVAPILASEWFVEVDKKGGDELEEIKEFIEEEFFPIRHHLLKSASLGCVDWGWAPYEKIFKQTNDGYWRIKKTKQLLQEMTTIEVVKKTGAFNGFKQDEDFSKVTLEVEDSLLFYFDVEGTNWYGSALMKNVEQPFDDYEAVRESAHRYDKKVAGTHWVIKAPPGTSKVDGVEKTNQEIARSMANSLKANGSIIIPTTIKPFLESYDDTLPDEAYQWEIKLMEAGSSAMSSFNDRSAYLDKLKVRGLGFPERSILEGQFGTKAEAGKHGDFALTNVELRHDEILILLNWHYVNQLIRWNFGEEFENKVRIKATPLNNEKREVAAQIYEKILANPDILLDELSSIDTDQLKKLLDIPTNSEDAGISDLLKHIGDDGDE